MMNTVGEFKNRLMGCKGLALKRLGRGNLFPMVDYRSLKPRFGVYLKEARQPYGPKGHFWWGLNKGQWQFLRGMGCPQWVVLLFGAHEEGFAARAERVDQLVVSGKLYIQGPRPQYKVPEYKIHERRIRAEFSREFSESRNFKDISNTLGLEC